MIKASESVIMRVRYLLNVIESNATEGERDNARSLLQRLLSKHNLRIEDFDTETASYRKFPYNTKHEERLLLQIFARVKSLRGAVDYRKAKKGKRLFFYVTDAEYADVCQLFELYRRPLAQAIDDAVLAFLSVNNLLVPADENSEPFDAEALARYARAEAMSEALEPLPDPLLKLIET